MKLCWAHDQATPFGNAFGYSRSNRALQAGFVQAGGVLDPDAEMAFHFVYPAHYEPIPGRFNVMATMFEAEELPPCFLSAFKRSDAIVVPSTYCHDVFRPHTDVPILVVPLGVHLDHFVGIVRDRPKQRPFRWLWLGAHNPRKGWREVMEAWKYGFLEDPTVELYMKTTDQQQGVLKRANIFVDSRILDDDALLECYARADGFVFPSMGEGFGLTLLEAMATALPCVTTFVTGQRDFVDATVARRVRSEPVWMLLDERSDGATEPHRLRCQRALVEDLITQMRWVQGHWRKAQAMGLRAYQRAQGFSWEAAGRSLHTQLQTLVGHDRGDIAC